MNLKYALVAALVFSAEVAAVDEAYAAGAPGAAETAVVGREVAWGVDGHAAYRTVDGGRTWTRMLLPAAGLPATMIGSVMTLGQGQATLFHTANAGRSWVFQRLAVPLASVEHLRLTMLDRLNGVVQDFQEGPGKLSIKTLYITRDGGKHWLSR